MAKRRARYGTAVTAASRAIDALQLRLLGRRGNDAGSLQARPVGDARHARDAGRAGDSAKSTGGVGSGGGLTGRRKGEEHGLPILLERGLPTPDRAQGPSQVVFSRPQAKNIPRSLVDEDRDAFAFPDARAD